MVEEPKTMEDFKEIFNNHIELCEAIHDNKDLIPKALEDKIYDLVYKHFEP